MEKKYFVGYQTGTLKAAQVGRRETSGQHDERKGAGVGKLEAGGKLRENGGGEKKKNLANQRHGEIWERFCFRGRVTSKKQPG